MLFPLHNFVLCFRYKIMASGSKRWYSSKCGCSHDCFAHSGLQIQMLLVDTWLAVCLIPNVAFSIFLYLSNTRTPNLQPTLGLHKFGTYNVEFWNCWDDLYSLERPINGSYLPM